MLGFRYIATDMSHHLDKVWECQACVNSLPHNTPHVSTFTSPQVKRYNLAAHFSSWNYRFITSCPVGRGSAFVESQDSVMPTLPHTHTATQLAVSAGWHHTFYCNGTCLHQSFFFFLIPDSGIIEQNVTNVFKLMPRVYRKVSLFARRSSKIGVS